MAESSSITQILTFAAQATAIVIGWVVVHRLSSQRDRDKARREMIAKSADTLSDDCKKLLVAAHKYHKDARDTSQEIAIKMAIQDIALRIQSLSILSNEESLLARCRAAIRAYRRAITGTHFEDEHTAPAAEGDEQFQLIAAEALKIQAALLNLKHSQFAKDN